MDNVTEFIESGILELYILGLASKDEEIQVEALLATHSEMKFALRQFSNTLEHSAKTNSIPPPSYLKTLVSAFIHNARLQEASPLSKLPPVLHPESLIEDFRMWLDDPDYNIPSDFSNMAVKLLSKTDQVMTAVVWVERELPWEVHQKQIETFLIVEGTCDFILDDRIYKLEAGSKFTVPINNRHMATVTSESPCKFILQRIQVE